MENIGELVRLLPFYNSLSDAEKNMVASGASISKYQHGSLVHDCDGCCPGLLFLLKGSVRTLMISNKGREITLYKLNTGDCCVLSSYGVLCQISFEPQIVAIGSVEVLVINPKLLTKLMDNNVAVRCYLYELLASRYSTVMWVLQQIIFAGIDTRIATYFISEYKRSGSAVIRMTHEEIAEEINSAREVIARMLTRFANEGIVELPRRGEIRILDLERLGRIADDR